MDCKLSITTVCGARCATCPVWRGPHATMEFEDFRIVWDKLMASPMISRVLLNNTGDVNTLAKKMLYFMHIEANYRKPVVMTTNGVNLDYIPRLDSLIISFNGGDRESYERTTGLSFDRIVRNIRTAYEQIERKVRYAEIDCLVWTGNVGCEDAFGKLWADFPGRVRISYKVENQFGEDMTLPEYVKTERRYCYYLDWLSVAPTGQVIPCAHDFKFETNWGNLLRDSVDAVLLNKQRIAKQVEHLKGEYTGLCERCNFNTPEDGKVVFLK